jgi:hypothetical protein
MVFVFLVLYKSTFISEIRFLQEAQVDVHHALSIQITTVKLRNAVFRRQTSACMIFIVFKDMNRV